MLKIMKENKKKAISLIIGLLLIFGGILYIVVSNSDAKEDNNIKVSANSIKELRKDKQDAKVELEKAKESGNKAEIAKAEKKLESIEKKEAKVVSNSGNSSNGGNAVKKGNTGNTTKPSVKPSAPSTPSTPKPKEKQKVWIVDKAAWTETVQEPIYSTRTYWVVQTQDGSKTKCYSEYEAQVLCAETDYSSYYEDTEQYISGYNTKTINHPEQGHWEYR